MARRDLFAKDLLDVLEGRLDLDVVDDGHVDVAGGQLRLDALGHAQAVHGVLGDQHHAAQRDIEEGELVAELIQGAAPWTRCLTVWK